MSDGAFLLAVFLFFFAAWVAGGGPSKPISFAGPYITPITTENVIQTGYGSTGGSSGSFGSQSISAAKGTLGSIQQSLANLNPQVQKAKLFGTASPYDGEVTISWGNSLGNTDPTQEYITIAASSGNTKDIDITGWKLTSVGTDRTITIPQGQEIYSQTSSAVSDILLRPGDEAIINSGSSPLPLKQSFRENECMGYFTQGEQFNPSLTQTCPSAIDDFNAHYTGNQFKDGNCYQLIQNLNSCQIPDNTSQASNDCNAFINQYFNYPGCVANHSNDQYFSGTTWRVFLNRDIIQGHQNDSRYYGPVWLAQHDAIKLLDKNGLTVDLYEYQ